MARQRVSRYDFLDEPCWLDGKDSRCLASHDQELLRAVAAEFAVTLVHGHRRSLCDRLELLLALQSRFALVLLLGVAGWVVLFDFGSNRRNALPLAALAELPVIEIVDSLVQMRSLLS